MTRVATSSTPERWRLVLTDPACGAENMALDQTLLENASQGGFRPTLRFYRWWPAAVSIGRFQPLEDVDVAAAAAEHIDVVRRPTGGKSILHLDDFTYSTVMPRSFPLPEGVVEAYRLICGGILRAFKDLGLDTVLQPRESGDYRQAGTGRNSPVARIRRHERKDQRNHPEHRGCPAPGREDGAVRGNRFQLGPGGGQCRYAQRSKLIACPHQLAIYLLCGSKNNIISINTIRRIGGCHV